MQAMTPDQKLDFLLISSKRILAAFQAGHNPTEDQLHKLECAIMAYEFMLLCGHQLREECDCAEEGQLTG